MKNNEKFDFYYPIFESLCSFPVYLGELFGLDHQKAKKQYEEMKDAGFYDDVD